MGREFHSPGDATPVLLATWPLTLPTDFCGGYQSIPAAPKKKAEKVEPAP